MNDELFEELVASVREGGAIMRGEVAPSRRFEGTQGTQATPDVRNIRDGYGLSQAEFAALLGISVATLRNWEQGRRAPEGPARVLLRVAARHPKAVWDVVRPQKSQSGAPTRKRRPLQKRAETTQSLS